MCSVGSVGREQEVAREAAFWSPAAFRIAGSEDKHALQQQQNYDLALADTELYQRPYATRAYCNKAYEATRCWRCSGRKIKASIPGPSSYAPS